MTTGVACPTPILQFFDNQGNPAVRGSVLTQVGGVNTPTFSDVNLTVPLPNPIPLNSRGEVSTAAGISSQLFLTPNVAYTFTLFDANGNQLNQSSYINGVQLNQQAVGDLIWPQTGAEADASIIPSSTAFPPLSPYRYGADGSGGSNDATAFAAIASVVGELGLNYLWWPLNSQPLDRSDVRMYGVRGDGVTDDSTEFQNAINANKGGVVYVPHGLRPMIAGVTLIGSTYDGTILRIDGELLLKPSTGAGTQNYQGAWVGIAFENCSRCQFEGNWNGNRANQPADEHIFCIALSGVTDWRSDGLAFREIRGDGIYLNQVLWDSNGSPGCQNVTIGSISGYNSADDGRNLISVIACVGLNIGSLLSVGIGGVVNGVTEPGGLDIEPNEGFQACADIAVGSLVVVTAGAGGLNIHGVAITNDATRDWNVRRVNIGAATVNNTNTTTNSASLAITRARDVKITAVVNATTQSAVGNECATIDFCDRVDIDARLNGGFNGCLLGFSDWVFDSQLRLNVTGWFNFGLLCVGLGRSRITGRIHGAAAGTSPFMMDWRQNGRGAITWTDVVFSVDCPNDGVVTHGIVNEVTGITVGIGTCIRDCDMTGYASFDVQIDAVNIPTYNVAGRNVANGLTVPPGNGFWALGDEVVFNQTAGATIPRAKCILQGNPGTWKTYAVMSA